MVSSTQLFVGTLTTSAADVYTVPPATRVILRDVQVRAATGTATGLYLAVVPSGGSATYFLYVPLAGATAAGDNARFSMWVVLNPGDKLRALTPASTAVLVLSGTSLNVV